MQLHHGDCLDIMPLIPSGSVDAIIADLPYGTTACKWDSVIPFEPLWEQYKRVIKDNGAIVLTASQPFTSVLACSNLKMFKYEWIWEKSMASNFATANKIPMKYHENILVFYKKQPTYNPIREKRSEIGLERLKNSGKILNSTKGRIDHINIKKPVYSEYDINTIFPKSVQKFNSEPNCNGTKLHPTQKPVALMEYLIKTYTNEGETVLDNTMGSGTTGVACKQTNRNFIGIEKEKQYFDIAVRRINEMLL
jgi:DNA modification methylase